jgi:hypothetical protein
LRLVRLLCFSFQAEVFGVVPHRGLIDYFPGNGKLSLRPEKSDNSKLTILRFLPFFLTDEAETKMVCAL